MRRSLSIFPIVVITVFLSFCPFVFAQDSGPMNDGTLNGLFARINPGSRLGSDSATPDLFTGAMSYSIPIAVPAGRKGVEPKIALTYRSSQQNGWLGLGWELEISSIERGTKNGVDYNGDNYILRMNGAGIDLIRVGDEYRAKIESRFLRIRASKDGSGRPISWEVTDKNGIRYFYGQTSHTRQDDPADPNRVFKWCLERVEDTNGNYMMVSYSKQDGQIYLEQIDYTGNGTMAPRNVVRFVRDAGSRPDAPVMYKSNFGVKTAYRLTNIIITADGNPVRSYKLTYTQSSETAQSILQSVQQFGKDDVSTLPAVQMEYAPESKSFTSSKLWYQGSATYPNTDTYWGWVDDQYRFGDFDGDGRADVLHFDTRSYPEVNQMGCNSVALSNGSGFNRAECWSQGGTFNGAYGWRQSIPVSDFDGDGKTDFAYIIYGYYGTGLTNYVVGLSKGFGYGVTGAPNYTGDAGFGLSPGWLSRPGWLTKSGQVWAYFRTADFNADGKTDVVYLGTGGALEVSLSTGSSFTTAAPWATLGNGSLSRYRFADYNGDGRDDVLFIGLDGSLQVAVSTGSGFDTSSLPWGAKINGSDSSRYLVGELNGDGKSDLVFLDASGNLYAAISTGSGFIVSLTPWVTVGNGNPGYYRFGDFNGDGKSDVLFTGDTGLLSVMLSTGTGFTAAKQWGSLGAGAANGAWGRYTVADFNGDGRADVWYVKGSYASKEQASFFVASSSEQPDNFLVRISNGIGAKTDITYQQSTNYANTGLPFPVQTVSKVKSDDGNGNIAETQYDYSGGYYHSADREFRGFNRAMVTGPAGPSGERTVTETWFHQGNDTVVGENNPHVSPGYMSGKPYRTRIKDGAGSVYSETHTNYHSDADTSDGLFNPPSEIITYYCEGAGSVCDSNTAGQSSKVKLYYDIYGNLNREEVYDTANATAPYRTTQRIFTVENTANYLVGYPAFETVYEGAAMSGNEVSSTAFYYDDPADCASLSRSKNQMPTTGNVTTVVRWLSNKPANGVDPEVNISYDSYGNMACSRDPKGYVSRLSYDHDTRTYITSATNPKGHVKSTRYYGLDGIPADVGLYGQVKSVTDPNLAAVTMEYDALGRKVRLRDPRGITSQNGTVSYSYHDNVLGSVGQQRITTYATTDYATQAYIWSESYFDGFGRTVKTRTQGPDSKVVASTTSYDVRGAINASSLPYFEGVEAPRSQAFKYDSRGRIMQVTNPDLTTEKRCYSSGVTVVLDPEGRRKRVATDVFGRIAQIDEYDALFTDCTTALSTPYATTRYQHDVTGNLRFVTDAENNRTELRYDSLGRKQYMKEPNMGEWRYYYDANGNLEYQVDAKNQTTRYSYDELNRLTLKDYPDDQDVIYTYDVAPDGVTTTYSVGRLSTMVDASGSVKFYYDKSGRVIRTIKRVDGTDYDFRAYYDAMSRLTGITYPDSETVSYAYNEGGLLKSVSDSSINYATFERYNALGQSGIISYGNGVSTSHEYYSSNSRLKTIVTKFGEERFIDLAYNYSSAGNITGIVDNLSSARSQSFWHDGLNRIQQAQSQSYGVRWYDYTVNGNIKLKEGISYDYTGPMPHAVKSTSDGRGYEYDANGNMIYERQGVDVYRAIDYYNNNMPKSIAMGGLNTSFVYDGAGARVKKTTSGIDQIYIGKLYQCSSGSCTKFIFAGDNRIAMKNGAEVYYYHQDHLGSTLVVTDSRVSQDFTCSGGSVRIAGSSPKQFSTLQAAYDAAVDGDVIQARDAIFTENLNLNRAITITISGGYNCNYTSRVERTQLLGMLTSNTGRVTIENFEIVITGKVRKKVQDVQYLPFGSTSSDIGFVSVGHKFTAQEEDAETGLYYYNARYYNPRLGRFISADPTVPDPLNPQALNRYSYVINDPLHYVDPSGYDYVPYADIHIWAPTPDTSGSGGYPSFAFSSGGSSSSFGGSPSFMPNYSSYNNYVNYVNSMSARPSASSYVPSVQNSGAGSSGLNSVSNLSARWSDWTSVAGDGLNLFGTGATVGEYGHVFEGSWRGINGKWYSSTWGGNQSTGGRSAAFGTAKLFRVGGYGIFAFSAGLNAYQAYEGYQSNDNQKIVKAGADLSVGAYAVLGGPVGVGVGLVWWGADLMGAFDGPPSPIVIWPMYYDTRDHPGMI